MSRIRKFNLGIRPMCLAAVSMVLPLTALSGEIGDIQWHGYLTSALMITSDGEYSGDVTDAGGTKDTRMGLNISTQVDESLSFVAQIKGKDTEKFVMELDWAFASYDFDESTTLRFGKIKYPVGMYNEYIDIGYTYPWIRPPEGFYNQDASGPNLTRVSYQGFDAGFTTFRDNIEFGLNLFGGVVDVPDGHMNQLVGAKLSINMEDEIRFELSGASGVMDIDNSFGRKTMMDGERHTAYTAGVVADFANFIVSSEFGSATMGQKHGGERPMDMNSGYIMGGYRLDGYMPHITWEKWNVNGGWGQKIIGVGVLKELTTNSVLKLEVRRVTPETTQKPTGGVGLFEDVPSEKNVTLVGVAIEMVF